MRIHSDSFEHRQPIPAEFALGAPGGFGGNRNPHLAWDDAPAGTRSFALLCIDTDAPTDGALVANAAVPIPVAPGNWPKRMARPGSAAAPSPSCGSWACKHAVS